MEKKWKNPGSSHNSYYRKFYDSWKLMKNRVDNKRGDRPTYNNVSICEEWLNYDNFFNDMASSWWPGATLDKDIIKPGNKIYCKQYCKWVSRTENSKELHKRNPELRNKIRGKRWKITKF